MCADLQQMICRSDRGPCHRERLMSVRARHDQLVTMPACMCRSEQKSSCGPKLASQTQLAVEFSCVVDLRRKCCRLDLLRGDQDAQRNRQVEAPTFFRKIG